MFTSRPRQTLRPRQLQFYSRQLPLSVDQHRWPAFSLSDDAEKSGLHERRVALV